MTYFTAPEIDRNLESFSTWLWPTSQRDSLSPNRTLFSRPGFILTVLSFLSEKVQPSNWGISCTVYSQGRLTGLVTTMLWPLSRIFMDGTGRVSVKACGTPRLLAYTWEATWIKIQRILNWTFSCHHKSFWMLIEPKMSHCVKSHQPNHRCKFNLICSSL